VALMMMRAAGHRRKDRGRQDDSQSQFGHVECAEHQSSDAEPDRERDTGCPGLERCFEKRDRGDHA
jgi:hypothetical protein